MSEYFFFYYLGFCQGSGGGGPGVGTYELDFTDPLNSFYLFMF